MPIEIRLPQLGESITHARLSQWLKRDGDRVQRGDVVAEVETDKTSVEIEAPGDGVLTGIQVLAGTDKVPVHALLALIVDSADVSVSASGPAAVAIADSLMPAASSDPRPDAQASGADSAMRSVLQGAASIAAAAGVVSPQVSALAADQTAHDDGHVAASPLARRMAAVAGIDLRGVRGSGPGGRIIRADIEGRLAGGSSRGASAPTSRSPQAVVERVLPPAPADDADPSRYDVVTLSTMRRVSAERLTAAKQQIPHFYLRVECAMDDVARARVEINTKRTDPLSFTSFALRSAALALRKVPAANASWADGAVRLYKSVDLAVAVNTDAGLVAPVVRAADTKSVVALHEELRALAERARHAKLKPDEYSGGTCTVSNLGMFGITSLYPIINPPQACILGMGAIEERPVVRNHALAVGLMMTCTLAADHRALDGATGAAFLSAFRDFIQDPWALLM